MKQKLNSRVMKLVKRLQLLGLQETGIRTLDDMSSFSPHLQKLHVFELCLERFRLRTLPTLKSLTYQDFDIWRPLLADAGKKRARLEGKDLLTECPDLQQVAIMYRFFEMAQLMKPTWNGLHRLEHTDVDVDKELPDLISAVQTLESLKLIDFKKLERVDLSAAFSSLKLLKIMTCQSLVEVRQLGLQQDLRSLTVGGCSELCALSGVEDLKLLEVLRLVDCCSLLQQSGPSQCLGGLTCLRELALIQRQRQRALNYKNTGLEDLRSSVKLEIASAARISAPINLANLTNLEYLSMRGMV
ncbi:hypothetical protein L7F22_028900 [Adiantum nelumboides]|nr:hypothetical protein [Adiantum nelumboides]